MTNRVWALKGILEDKASSALSGYPILHDVSGKYLRHIGGHMIYGAPNLDYFVVLSVRYFRERGAR